MVIGNTLRVTGVTTSPTLHVPTEARIQTGIVTTISGTTATYTTGTISNLHVPTEARIQTGIITTLSGTDLRYTGVGTIASAAVTSLNVSGVTTTPTIFVPNEARIALGIVTTISGTTATYTTGTVLYSSIKLFFRPRRTPHQ